jgi:hypothetical protein
VVVAQLDPHPRGLLDVGGDNDLLARLVDGPQEGVVRRADHLEQDPLAVDAGQRAKALPVVPEAEHFRYDGRHLAHRHVEQDGSVGRDLRDGRRLPDGQHLRPAVDGEGGLGVVVLGLLDAELLEGREHRPGRDPGDRADGRAAGRVERHLGRGGADVRRHLGAGDRQAERFEIGELEDHLYR